MAHGGIRTKLVPSMVGTGIQLANASPRDAPNRMAPVGPNPTPQQIGREARTCRQRRIPNGKMTRQELLKTLPEPARTTWLRGRGALAEAIRRRIPDFEGWAISGGTILVAQFGHRQSTDIDLKVRPKTGLVRLSPRYDPTFDNEIRAVGAETPTHRQNQIVIPLGRGKIDIFEADSIPRIGQEELTIEGHKENVLSNAQILGGKLSGRGLSSPTRDLFDFAVMSEVDPEAMEIAVNCITENTWRETTARWREEAAAHSLEADKRLKNVPDRWAEIAADPANAAVERTNKKRYRRVVIKQAANELLLETECAEEERRTRRLENTESKELEGELERYGICTYLEERTWNRMAKVLENIKEARGRNQIICDTIEFPELATQTQSAGPIVVRGAERPVGGGTPTPQRRTTPRRTERG